MKPRIEPPRSADRLLEWFCAPHLLEDIQGDLHEEFTYQVKLFGERRARWLYWWEIVGFVQPRYIKRQKSPYSTTYSYSPTMIGNYFKIAFRNLLKHKGYSFINIFGLATGMAVAILISLWVWDELNFNKYHKNYDRIAQIYLNQTFDGKIFTDKSIPVMLGDELKAKHGDLFEHVVMASWPGFHTVSFAEKNLNLKGLYMGAGAPKMLSLYLKEGSQDGLRDINSVLISASMAASLFGNENALNKVLHIDDKQAVKVTGIFEDLPKNTEWSEISFIAPFDLYVETTGYIKKAKENNQWSNNNSLCYVQLAENKTFKGVAHFIANIKKDNMGEQARKSNPVLFLNPMQNWYLWSKWENGQIAGGPIENVWLFGGIGVFILLLASVNFMNLSTARSEKKAKEVGVRKVSGSTRLDLIYYFLGESMLIAGLSFVLSIVLVWLSISWFNEITAKQINVPYNQVIFWLIGLTFSVLVGIVSGSYPSLYLSKFQPQKVLKGTFKAGRYAALPRKSLVVFQFAVSIILILGTIVVYRQVQLSQNRPVGYEKKGLITLEMKSEQFSKKFEVLRTALKNSEMVSEVSGSLGMVTQVYAGDAGFSWKGKEPGAEVSFGTLSVTPEHGKTINWKIKQGRDFNRNSASDSSGIILNETAVKTMNLSNPVGENIVWKSPWGQIYNYTVLGVIEDMIMESPYEPVRPTAFLITQYLGPINWMNIKINPTKAASEALPKIGSIFKDIAPTVPFEYVFVDEKYGSKFKKEVIIGKLASLFATLAIFISCLGLFGLASFVAEQRTKEIGIRKVLGASVAGLWQMLSKEFVLLVLIACLIATPIAYYFMNNWLQKYSYRTEINWWIFIVTGLGALVITLLTVSFQAVKAALMNPVESLKTE